MKKIILSLIFTFIGIISTVAQTKKTIENEVWNMEKHYWEYVQKSDTIPYKKLWHNDFIGYSSFGDGVSNVAKIAAWIPILHENTTQQFSYVLNKKAINAIGNVVIVFYDVDEIWTNKENEVVRKETYKFTHTWKKYKGTWLIIGGMAAKKL
jgi:hypothetical protein